MTSDAEFSEAFIRFKETMTELHQLFKDVKWVELADMFDKIQFTEPQRSFLERKSEHIQASDNRSSLGHMLTHILRQLPTTRAFAIATTPPERDKKTWSILAVESTAYIEHNVEMFKIILGTPNIQRKGKELRTFLKKFEEALPVLKENLDGALSYAGLDEKEQAALKKKAQEEIDGGRRDLLQLFSMREWNAASQQVEYGKGR